MWIPLGGYCAFGEVLWVCYFGLLLFPCNCFDSHPTLCTYYFQYMSVDAEMALFLDPWPLHLLCWLF